MEKWATRRGNGKPGKMEALFLKSQVTRRVRVCGPLAESAEGSARSKACGLSCYVPYRQLAEHVWASPRFQLTRQRIVVPPRVVRVGGSGPHRHGGRLYWSLWLRSRRR